MARQGEHYVAPTNGISDVVAGWKIGSWARGYGERWLAREQGSEKEDSERVATTFEYPTRHRAHYA